MLNSYHEFMAKSADKTGTAEKEHVMLTSYPVTCPHENCGWTGNLIPSHFRAGENAVIVAEQMAWLHCPRCGSNWEMRFSGDSLVVLPVYRPAGSASPPGP
jgi:Zn finger protein HypA/HybF involved in hydrogenase expression